VKFFIETDREVDEARLSKSRQRRCHSEARGDKLLATADTYSEVRLAPAGFRDRSTVWPQRDRTILPAGSEHSADAGDTACIRVGENRLGAVTTRVNAHRLDPANDILTAHFERHRPQLIQLGPHLRLR